jgi:hypothetical protein
MLGMRQFVSLGAPCRIAVSLCNPKAALDGFDYVISQPPTTPIYFLKPKFLVLQPPIEFSNEVIPLIMSFSNYS